MTIAKVGSGRYAMDADDTTGVSAELDWRVELSHGDRRIPFVERDEAYRGRPEVPDLRQVTHPGGRHLVHDHEWDEAIPRLAVSAVDGMIAAGPGPREPVTTNEEEAGGLTMKGLQSTRRGFLAGTAAIGAAGIAGLPRWALAQERVLRLRFDGDNSILDPGYMVGGTEVESQKQCLPFLTEYVIEDGTLSWQPTYYVKKVESPRPDAYRLRARGLPRVERRARPGHGGGREVLVRAHEGDRLGRLLRRNGPCRGDRRAGRHHRHVAALRALHHGHALPRSGRDPLREGDEGGRRKVHDRVPGDRGPYTYEQIPGQRTIFRLNPDWKGPKPDFERVDCNIITEVKAAELAFEAGELDCTEIGADTLARYKTELPADAALTVAGELQYMWMGMNTDHPKLQDKNVRRAIQHAVDVDSILQGAYSGTTAKSNGIVCPGLVGHRDATKYYSYDPDKARELLQEAGVSDLSLTLRTLNNQERMLTAQIIQANLAAVGITVEIIPLDSGPFWDVGMEDKGDGWKDIQLYLMRFGSQPDPYEATQWFVSDQVGVWNWERWTDPEFDALYKQGIAETDPAKRAEIYLRMQDIMEETGAYVWINHEPEAYAHRADIEISSAPSGELDYRRFKQL